MNPISVSTRYLGPTNTRGSRVRVFGNGKQRTYSWDYSCDVGTNHKLAMHAFILDVVGILDYGVSHYMDTKDGKGYVFTIQVEVK